MSANTANRLEQLVVSVCWEQWRAVRGDGIVVAEHPARSIIDPEALVLASLCVRHVEARLGDTLLWWTQHGARLMSVQRLRTMSSLFPEEALGVGVEQFAALCVQAGHPHWKSLADGHDAPAGLRAGKGARRLVLLDPSTCMLRLRAAFGVGAKADLLAFLLGAAAAVREQELWTTVEVMAAATHYSKRTVSRATDDMLLARFLERSADRPPLYWLRADLATWSRLLDADDVSAAAQRERSSRVVSAHPVAAREPGAPGAALGVPAWRFWSQQLGFLLHALAWCRASGDGRRPRVVSASLARDITDRFEQALNWNGISRPDPRELPGERYADAFEALLEEALDATAGWL